MDWVVGVVEVVGVVGVVEMVGVVGDVGDVWMVGVDWVVEVTQLYTQKVGSFSKNNHYIITFSTYNSPLQ